MVTVLPAWSTAAQVKCQVKVLGDVWLLRDGVGRNQTQPGAMDFGLTMCSYEALIEASR